MANNTLSVNITANTSEAQGEVDKLQAKVEKISAASLKKELQSIKELMKEALKSGDSDAFSNLSKQAQAVENQLKTLPKPMKSLKQAAREAKNEVQKLSMAGLKSGDAMFDEAVKKAGLLERKVKATTATIEKSADAASSIHSIEEAFGAVDVVTTQASAAIKGLTGAEVDLSGASEKLGVVTGALNGALSLKTALGAKSYFQTQILAKITETYNTILAAQNIQESTSGIVKAGLTAKTVVLTAAQTAYNSALTITKFLTGDVVGITLMLGAAVVGTAAYFISAQSEQEKYNDAIQNTIDTHGELISTLKELIPMYSTEEVAAFYNQMASSIQQFKDAQNDDDESSKREKTKEVLDEIAEKENIILSTSDMITLSEMDQEKCMRLLAIEKNAALNKAKETANVERITKGFSKDRLTYLQHLVTEYNNCKTQGKSVSNVLQQWNLNFTDVIEKGYTFEDVVKNINATTSQTKDHFNLFAAEFQDKLNSIKESSYQLCSQFRSMAAVWNQLDNATKIRQFDTMKTQLRQMGIYVQTIADAESVFGHNAGTVSKILMKQAQYQAMAQYAGELRAQHAILNAKPTKTAQEISELSTLSGQISAIEKAAAEGEKGLSAEMSKLSFFNPPKVQNYRGSSPSISSISSSSSSSSKSSSSKSSSSSNDDFIKNANLEQLNKKYLDTWEKLDFTELQTLYTRLKELKKAKPNEQTGLLSSDIYKLIAYTLKHPVPKINEDNIDEFIQKYNNSHAVSETIANKTGTKFYKEENSTGAVEEVSEQEYQKNVNSSSAFRYFSQSPKLSIAEAERYNRPIEEYNETEQKLYDQATVIVENASRAGIRFDRVIANELKKLNDLPDDAKTQLINYVRKIADQKFISISDKNGNTSFASQEEAMNAANNYIKEHKIQDTEAFVYMLEDGSWVSTYRNPNQYVTTKPKSIQPIEADSVNNPYFNYQEQQNGYATAYDELAKKLDQKANDISNPRQEMSDLNRKIGLTYQTDFKNLPSEAQQIAFNELYKVGGEMIPDFAFDPKSMKNISTDTKRTLISLLVTNFVNQKNTDQKVTPQDVSDKLKTYLEGDTDLSQFVNINKEIDYEGLEKYFSENPQKITDPSAKFLLTTFSDEKKQNGVNGNYMKTWKEQGFYGQRVQPDNESDEAFQNKLKEKQEQVGKFKETLNEMQQVTSTVANSISSIFGALANDSSKQWAKMATEIAKFAGSIVTSALGVVSAYLTMSAAKAVGNSSKDIISFAIAVAAAATTLTVGIISLTQNLKKHAQGGILGKFAQGTNSMSGVFSGNSVGDMNLARVNGGEMIINKNQQTRLFNQLNQPINNQPATNQKVQFVIRGKDLYGTLQNHINLSQKL